MKDFKLIANNGAELEVKENSFCCNGILFKKHSAELTYSDCNGNPNEPTNEIICWGDRSDYGYSGLHDGVLKNIAVMMKHYPETREQFINYILRYGDLSHSEIMNR